MFPPHRPLPSMVFQDMCVQVFRPSEVAGGMSRNTKSNANNSSSGNISANISRSNAHNVHNIGNKGTKPGYSMSAYLGGSANRSAGYNGQSNSSSSGDKLVALNDMDSPEWIPTHSRTSTSNHNNTNRMSLSNMFGATSHSNKTSEILSVQDYNNYADTDGGNDEWGFDQYESYDAMRDTSSDHSNSRKDQNYAVQTSSSDDVYRHCNTTSNAYNNNQHSHGSSYHDSSTVNDDAALYGWGADVPSSTALNSNHHNPMKDKPVPVESTRYTTNTNNWVSNNTNNHSTVKKAIEVVDLLDSPLVKNNKRPASLLPSSSALTTTATAYDGATSTNALPTAAPLSSFATSSVVIDRVSAQHREGSIVATTSISAPTSNSSGNAVSIPTNNLVPRAVFKPNVSSIPNNRNTSFGGIRLTNIVRSTNRNISFVALDDDLSFSSADEAIVPAAPKQNVDRSVAALRLPSSSNIGSRTDQGMGAVESTLYKPSCMSIADSRPVNTNRAPFPSTKGFVNEDMEGLSDTQSESEGKPDSHTVRKNKYLISDSALGESSASVPNVNKGTVESAPLPPPRSQYVDNSGIDWGSSSSGSSGSSSGESQDPEKENPTLYMEPLDDIDSEIKKRRKVPRIQETQECFFSQCSISEEEEDNRKENKASTPRLVVSVKQRQVSTMQGSRAPQVNAAHSRTGTNKTDAKEDSGCESDNSDASDTANACCACLDHISYEHDVIVFCEGLCGACIHVSCYGVLYNGVPEGDFYCEGCTHTLGITNTSYTSAARADKRKAKKESHRRSSKATCALCFRSGGLMTLSTTDTFVHPICVLFTPELTFCPETSRANNLTSLDKDRKYIKCEVCQEIGGAVVQCAETCCLKAAHPFCAYEARRQMVVRVHNAEDGSQGHQAAGLAFTQHHTQNIHHKQNQENCDGGQYNTYELYCAKHKSLPSTQKQKDSIIATSRLPLRDPSITSHDTKNSARNTNGKRQDKKQRKRSNGHSIGIADQKTYSSDDSIHDASTATKRRKGVQFVVKKGGAQERKSGESNASSPGDLVDTAEKPPRDLKKKRSKSDREEVGDRHNAKHKHKHKRRRTDPAVARFFELEAVLSGSDSGDDEGISEDGEGQDSDASGSSESTQLSGNFINDGTYTQHSPQGDATQYGMYLAVNNYHSHMHSPDDFVRGKLNVAGLVRRKPLLQSPSDLQDTQASDASPNSSIVDTPQGTPDQQQGRRDRWKSASWLDSGTQEGASDETASSDENSSDGDDDTREIESELDSARKSNKNAGTKKGDLRDQNYPRVPQKSSLMAQLSKKPARDGALDKNTTKIKPVSNKFALSHEKENSSVNAATAAPSRTKSTFFNKLALRGLQDNSSDDSDQETKKTKRSHKISAASTTAASSACVPAKHTAKGPTTGCMAVAVDLTSSPLCPVSASRNNNLGLVDQSKSVPAAPNSPFGWGF
eukprot:gene17182-19590_t